MTTYEKNFLKAIELSEICQIFKFAYIQSKYPNLTGEPLRKKAAEEKLGRKERSWISPVQY